MVSFIELFLEIFLIDSKNASLKIYLGVLILGEIYLL